MKNSETLNKITFKEPNHLSSHNKSKVVQIALIKVVFFHLVKLIDPTLLLRKI